MKTYKVLTCSVNQLEKRLNKACKEEWSLTAFSIEAGKNAVAILETTKKSANDIFEDSLNLQASVVNSFSNILRLQQEVLESIVRNLKR